MTFGDPLPEYQHCHNRLHILASYTEDRSELETVLHSEATYVSWLNTLTCHNTVSLIINYRMGFIAKSG